MALHHSSLSLIAHLVIRSLDLMVDVHMLRDWSLITGRGGGGLQNGRGGM